MMKIRTKISKMFILGFKQLQDPYYQGFAAQIAFYLLLSIVPIILLVTQILGIFGISLDSAFTLIEDYTGKTFSKTLESLFKFSSLGFGNIIFLIIALWAGSRASFSIMRITNYTMTEGQNTGRNFFIERFRSIKTMMITIMTLVFSIVILIYGELILQFILSFVETESVPDYEFLWFIIKWPIGFALYFLMISYNYYILPTERVKFKKIIPGSIFASAGIFIVTMIYSKYVTSLADYDILYGALSSVVAIMFWFYLLAWVLCLGVLCNKVWQDVGEDRTVK